MNILWGRELYNGDSSRARQWAFSVIFWVFYFHSVLFMVLRNRKISLLDAALTRDQPKGKAFLSCVMCRSSAWLWRTEGVYQPHLGSVLQADLGLLALTNVRAAPAEVDGSRVAEVTVGTRGCLCVALLSGNYVNNNRGELWGVVSICSRSSRRRLLPLKSRERRI